MSRNNTGYSESGLEEVCAVFSSLKAPNQVRQFLEEILTPAEQRDLALRWELMKKLKEGIPQRKIAAQLGISLCKITRGAKILKQDQSISKRYLDAGETHGQKDPIE